MRLHGVTFNQANASTRSRFFLSFTAVLFVTLYLRSYYIEPSNSKPISSITRKKEQNPRDGIYNTQVYSINNNILSKENANKKHINSGNNEIASKGDLIYDITPLTQDDEANVQNRGRKFAMRQLFSAHDHEVTDSRCTHATGASEEFPQDYFTRKQRQKGAIIVHIFVMLYMFGLLAQVCDDYFVLSLYHICSRLKLDKDVAGATFMAVGSSAPTLFIAIVSIFFTESGGDVGLGTVVGSTIFNTLFIIGICCLATQVPLKLKHWPLIRDSFVYTLGTVSLVITVRDREVHWYEAIVFVFIYLFYILIMYFNKPLSGYFMRLIEERWGMCGEIDTSDDDTEAYALDTEDQTLASLLSQDNKPCQVDKTVQTKTVNSQGNTLDSLDNSKDGYEGLLERKQTDKQIQTTLHDISNSYDEQLAQFEHKQKSPFSIPPGFIPKIAWLLGFPVMSLFYLTIPPCCKRRWSEWFLVTFAMSVMWMGSLSYVLVWMVCIIGDTFDIPDCVMGMTFLAAGSSIPDVMASVIVARQGMADMAVSNAIGSNVFDLVCLGVPWLLKTLVLEKGTVVQIQSQSIMISALLLIGSIVFTVIAIHLNNWKLSPRLGFIFLLVYIVFISLATLLEFLACPCQIEDIW